MESTSVSLLERLKSPTNQEAWSRFVDLYTPLLYRFTQSLGVSHADAADLIQEIFVLLLRKMPEFTYDDHRSFRSWLRTVAHNLWRDRCRRRAARPNEVTGQVDVPEPEAFATSLGEIEYRQYLVRRSLELMQAEFQATTWKAFWEVVVHEQPAAKVAQQLGMSENAVHLAKGRVLRRLRQELQGLFDP